MKTICITGATDGLGKALAIELSKKGYKLILTGRNNTKMDELLNALPNNQVLYHECFDMLNRNAIATFINNINENDIDILINNAGANLKKDKVVDLNIDHLNDMLQLNCVSNVQLIQGVYPQMKARKNGHIINILSSCCKYTNETMAAYTASKNAMQAINNTLTKEARVDNIKVTAVYPGGIDTSFRAILNHDYLRPETVALTIINCIEAPDEAIIHELVIRPFVENNF